MANITTKFLFAVVLCLLVLVARLRHRRLGASNFRQQLHLLKLLRLPQIHHLDLNSLSVGKAFGDMRLMSADAKDYVLNNCSKTFYNTTCQSEGITVCIDPCNNFVAHNGRNVTGLVCEGANCVCKFTSINACPKATP
ncbi:hypothetical protein CASFOL_031294 [Castilleja foliolosa]|uniref:Uncharacterized protein n=1 Tax=Castilleja foliolosa TaxID=1961234 RepID=A0ABD3C675_9LAMI